MSASKLTSFRDNPELNKFVLKGVKRTGKSLGFGSFGSVEEITIGGTYYAGKKLHNTLLDDQNGARSQLLERMVTECKLMSELRHPNIVQFIGICFFDDYNYPVLVMEQLATNLDDLLVNKAGNLSLAEKLHILHDITKGLVYLHERSPPIIHRDLTTRNVLINSASMQAKIADLGNALMINPTKISSMLSQIPGTLVYMPPEATPLNPKYDSSLDMFSFGQLALHTIIQVLPVNLLSSTYEDPETEELKARSEVERRGQYFDMLYDILSKKHILCKTIKQCLSNKTSERPTATKMVKILEDCLGKPDYLKPGESNNNESTTSTARLGDEYLKLYKSRIEQLQRGTPGILEIYRSHGNFKFSHGNFKLHKRSEWKQYVFQISSVSSSPTPHLTFFKSNQEGAAVDQLQLAEVHTVRATATPFQDDDTSRFYFVVISNDKSWLLRAYSQEDCLCWMEAIKSGCSTCISKKTPPDSAMETSLFEPAWYSRLVHTHTSHLTAPCPPPPKPARLRHHNSEEATPTRQQPSSSSWDTVEEVNGGTTTYQVPRAVCQSQHNTPLPTAQAIAQRYEISDALQNSSSSVQKVPLPIKKRRSNPIRKALSQPSLVDKPQPQPPPKPAPRSHTRVACTSLPDEESAISKSNRRPSANEEYELMQGGSGVGQSQPSKTSPYTEPTRRIGPRFRLKPPIPKGIPPPQLLDTDNSHQQDEENFYEDLDKFFVFKESTVLSKPSKDYDPNQTLLNAMQPFEYCAFIPAGKNQHASPSKPLPPLPKPPTVPQKSKQRTKKKEKSQDKQISSQDTKRLKADEEATKYINVRKDVNEDEDKLYDDTCSIKFKVDELKKPYVNLFAEEFTTAIQEAVRDTPPLPPKPKLRPAVPPKPGGLMRPRAVTFSNSQRPTKKREQSNVDHKRTVSDTSESINELPPRNILRHKIKVPVPRPRSRGTG